MAGHQDAGWQRHWRWSACDLSRGRCTDQATRPLRPLFAAAPSRSRQDTELPHAPKCPLLKMAHVGKQPFPQVPLPLKSPHSTSVFIWLGVIGLESGHAPMLRCSSHVQSTSPPSAHLANVWLFLRGDAPSMWLQWSGLAFCPLSRMPQYRELWESKH